MSEDVRPFAWGFRRLREGGYLDTFFSLWRRNFAVLASACIVSAVIGVPQAMTFSVIAILPMIGVTLAFGLIATFVLINPLDFMHLLSGVAVLVISIALVVFPAAMVAVISPIVGGVAIVAAVWSAFWFWRGAAEPPVIQSRLS